ncbi:MAG: hypothetical protein ACRDS9_00640 [Pseudonocardiaceae bacterium]
MNDHRPTVRYTERWNDLLLQPIDGYDWIDADQARALFENDPDRGVMVVGGTEHEPTGEFAPRWVLGFSAGARVQFLDEQGSLVRLIDYDLIDGRLWRWVTVDYVHPNNTQRWSKRDAVQKIETTIRPDGRGYLTTLDKTDATTSRPPTETSEIVVPIKDSYWLDWPTFGDWAALTNPGPSAWEIAGQSLPSPTN